MADGINEEFGVASREAIKKLVADVLDEYDITEAGSILDKIRAGSLFEAVLFQANADDLITWLEDTTKAIRKVYDITRTDVVPGKMDEEGIANVKYDGIGKVCLQGDLYASIKAANKAEAYEWLDDNGYSSLIQPTVNASSLKATLKKRFKDGEEIPEDLFTVTPYTRAQITRG